MDSTGAKPTVRVLFLTVEHPSIAKCQPETKMIQKTLLSRGADVDILQWTDESITVENLSTRYSHVTFLMMDKYNLFISEFIDFIHNTIIPAREKNPQLYILNDPDIILWNYDKRYLHELQAAGFLVSETRFFNTADSSLSTIKAALRNLPASVTQVVMKPSVSASGRATHLLKDTHHLTRDDESYIEELLHTDSIGSIMIQDFEPDIETGELSLLFMNGRFTHAVNKIPAKGDFLAQRPLGGRVERVTKAEVSESAIAAATEMAAWVETRFGPLKDLRQKKLAYARIDGIPRADGSFVLIEFEAIEPNLHVHDSNEQPEHFDGLKEFVKAFFPN